MKKPPKNLLFLPLRGNPCLTTSLSLQTPNLVKISNFKDGEISLQLLQNISQKDIFIIQSISKPVNENLMELLLTTSMLKNNGAQKIHVFLTYMAYARQDKKVGKYKALSGGDIFHFLEKLGISSIFTLDIHSEQILCAPSGVWVENLNSSRLVLSILEKEGVREPVIVSPDLGGVKRCKVCIEILEGFLNGEDGNKDCKKLDNEKNLVNENKDCKKLDNEKNLLNENKDCKKLDDKKNLEDENKDNKNLDNKKKSCKNPKKKIKIQLAVLDKNREEVNKVKSMRLLIGNVENKDCIIIDDMIDTGSTILKAIKILKQLKARRVFVYVTHGLFNGDFYKNFAKCESIDCLYVSDSLPSPNPEVEKGLRIKRLSIKPILEEFVEENFGC